MQVQQVLDIIHNRLRMGDHPRIVSADMQGTSETPIVVLTTRDGSRIQRWDITASGITERVESVPMIVVIKNGVVNSTTMVSDRENAEAEFLSACQTYVSDWNEYKAEDIATVLDNGYCETVTGSVCLTWVDLP